MRRGVGLAPHPPPPSTVPQIGGISAGSQRPYRVSWEGPFSSMGPSGGLSGERSLPRFHRRTWADWPCERPLETLASNTLLDGGIEREIRALLSKLGEAKTNAGYVKTRYNFILHDLERREALETKAAKRGVAVSDLADYDRWRDSTDEAVGRVEHILANREDYGLHLHGAARGRESLASALSACARCLQRTTGTLRKPSRGGARARTCGNARSASPVSSTIRMSSGSCASGARSAREKASGSARAGISHAA